MIKYTITNKDFFAIYIYPIKIILLNKQLRVIYLLQINVFLINFQTKTNKFVLVILHKYLLDGISFISNINKFNIFNIIAVLYLPPIDFIIYIYSLNVFALKLYKIVLLVQ